MRVKLTALILCFAMFFTLMPTNTTRANGTEPTSDNAGSEQVVEASDSGWVNVSSEEVELLTVSGGDSVETVSGGDAVATVSGGDAMESVSGEDSNNDGTEAAWDTLYDALMVCKTQEEAEALIAQIGGEEQAAAFISTMGDEKIAALNEYLDTLPSTSIVEEEKQPVEEDNREIVYITKDYTDVAPFLAPVTGAVVPRMMRMASTAMAAAADMSRAAGDEEDNGLELDKTVSGPVNGVYTLTLEAYATGSKTIVPQETHTPTDIVLVLDQSGSMANSFTSTVYNPYTGTVQQLYGNRDDLYVKSGDAYSPVTITRTEIPTGYESYGGRTNNTYYNDRNNLYHLCSEGTYGKVSVSREWSFSSWSYNYTYTCANCGGLGTSNGQNTHPIFASSLYRVVDTVYQYTFSYVDANGQMHTETVMENGTPPTWDFYLATAGGNTTRIAALKNAVTAFADEVEIKAMGPDGVRGTDDDVKHTISVVGFGNGLMDSNGYLDYQNTEVFVGATQYGYSNAATYYTQVPQDMSTQAGVDNITASIGALATDGGTYVDCGIELANGILAANPVPAGETRNRVVIVFTDGQPGWGNGWTGDDYGDRYDSDPVANAAITAANTTKNTHNATVYTVGIFEGADATSAGGTNNDTDRANRFMQQLSSNNGIVQTPSYYLSASSSAALTSIFRTISQNIESGGTVVTLDEEAVLRDIISESFQLPDGADAENIKVYTAEYSANGFEEPVAFKNATIAISEDGKDISIKNFDYAENWVGTETAANGNVTYRGKKLIVEIPIVERPDFLGGDGVPTNGSGSGIYASDEDSEPIELFPAPVTNVPAKGVAPASQDQHIYYGTPASIPYVSNIGKFVVNGTPYEVDGINNAYVDIVYSIYDSESNLIGTCTIPHGQVDPTNIGWDIKGVDDQEEITEIINPTLENDTTYQITCTVISKDNPANKNESEPVEKNVYVYKPVLTFHDSEAWYGETIKDYNTNYKPAETVWKHGETEANPDMGPAPELVLTYDPAIDPTGGMLVGKNDIPVNVTVDMVFSNVTIPIPEQHLTFVHDTCGKSGCKFNAATEEFLIHVNTCTLTVTKSGGVEGEPYVIYVYKDDSLYTELTLNANSSETIYELPIGTYAIEEDTSWAWRYEGASVEVDDPVKLDKDTPKGTITCINNTPTPSWVNEFSAIVKNVFVAKETDSNN